MAPKDCTSKVRRAPLVSPQPAARRLDGDLTDTSSPGARLENIIQVHHITIDRHDATRVAYGRGPAL